MRGAQPQGRVVAVLRLGHLALLLEGVGQVAVGIGEVGLQLDRSPVRVDGEIDEALFVVHTGQVSVHNGIVGAQVEGAQVRRYRSGKRGFSLVHDWMGV